MNERNLKSLKRWGESLNEERPFGIDETLLEYADVWEKQLTALTKEADAALLRQEVKELTAQLAATLKSTAPTPRNPDEAACTPQTLHSPDTPNS